MEESLEEFSIGLEECVVEASPDFDEQPDGPPPKKSRQRKVATECLVTEIFFRFTNWDIKRLLRQNSI